MQVGNEYHKGISGCRLQLLHKKSHIRKISSNISYNQRLIAQKNKQNFFSNLKIPYIITPTIVNYSYDGELFFFDMEFISALGPIDFFIVSDKSDIDNFIAGLKSLFNFYLSSSRRDDILNFKNASLQKLKSLLEHSRYNQFIIFLISKINNVSSNYYDKTICHGDLTLSNMLCSDKDIYLLDFLDSYIDSIYVDFAKLKQDIFYMWSIHNFYYLNEVETFRINQIFDYIWSEISKTYSSYLESELFYIVEALNFLRIEPYVKGEKMKLYLDKTIKSLRLYEEFNTTDGRSVI